MTRIAKQTRQILKQAVREASDLNSRSVEAEHILLAISGQSGAGRAVLLEFGLDHSGIVGGLRAEFETSLSAAGVDISDYAELALTGAKQKRKKPKWGSSATLVVKRAALNSVIAEEKRRIEPAHLLLALLQAREGTVPRLLAAIDVDRRALTQRVEEEMAA